MLFLVLSIVCTALLVLLFKVFEKYGVDIFPAIVINYWTATICAFIFLPDQHRILNGAFFSEPWLPLAFVLGTMFITIFNLVSKTTVSLGVSTASIAFKLGLVFPVIFAFLLYHENFNWLKLLGILMAFAAVVLSSLKDDANSQKHHTHLVILPFVVFVGSGLCDSLTQYANKKYLMNAGIEEFTLFLFVAAGVAGTIAFIYQLIKGTAKMTFKSIAGGIALGIPNYLSFLFLLKALATLSWGSSVVFPISNLGTVACASVAGVLIFKEKLSKLNVLGLILAGLSILFIVLSNYLNT